MNGQDTEQSGKHVHITQSTYVSLGFVVCLILCTLWIKTGLNDNSIATHDTKVELSNQMDKLDTRLKSVETAKNSWSAVDMFKWAVQLQQLNDGREGRPLVKVPTPDVTK